MQRLSDIRATRESAGAPTRRPLARRFTIRYGLAITAFVLLVGWAITSVNDTLDEIDRGASELQAVAEQSARVHEIADMAETLASSEPGESTALLLTDYQQQLNEFHDVHLGLSAGTGSTGLAGINNRVRDVWDDRDLDAKVEQFWEESNALPNVMSPTRAVERAESLAFIQNASDPLRDESVTSALDAAVAVYTAQLEQMIDAQRSLNQLILLVGSGLALGAVFALFRPMARSIQLETTNLQEAERVHRENNERQTFRNQLNQALEVADNEDEIFERVAVALQDVLPESPAELLLADASNAHLRQAVVHASAGAPDCPVDSPWGCAAIRRGQTLTFETSRALNVCPKLTQHQGGPCSAICVPVTFTGRSLGVVHITGPDLSPPDSRLIERLNVIASETGSRLGTLRATKQTEMQASTDGLTGLANRRSLESAARDLIHSGRTFTVAMADLDHFKDLNDTYGHEAGDRALRLFAKSLRANLRPDDFAARFGGEEFVLLLPHTDVDEAEKALHRLRVTLAGDIESSGNAPFTASWGLAASTVGDTFEEMLAAADESLYAAKRAGRDRIVAGGGEATGGPGAADGSPDPTGPGPGGDGHDGGDGQDPAAGLTLRPPGPTPPPN